MKITSKGQVTIPADIREKAGLLPHTEVEFLIMNKRVVIRKSKKSGSGQLRGDELIATMRGKGSGTMSADEIMALTRGE